MALDAYDPTETRDPYYPDVDSTRANARLWSIDKLALDLAAVGIVQIFTGAGSNPTGLTGYATSKLWLQVSSGVTDAPATLRVYDGAGDATLEASWPTLASQGAAGLRRHLSVYSQAEVNALVTAGVPAGFGSDDVENDSTVTGATITAALDALKTLADAAVPTGTKGQPNGVASLDSGGKIPIGQIPASLTSPLKFQGTWNASTNTPTLADGTGTEGYVYRVSVAGTTSLDGEASWEVGDELYFDGTVWNKLSASGGDVTITLPTSSINGRVTVIGQTNGHGGGKFGMAATADGRIFAWGDTAALAFNPVGDRWRPYQLERAWPASATIEAIYLGINYALVQTDEATENLYAIGTNDDGQCGQGNTTAQTVFVKVTGLTGIHVDSVVTEGQRGNSEKFWFAITSTGAVYSCGYSGAQHVQGYNNTADLTTPRLMTQSDGTTPLANIVEISCDAAYAPVWARDSSNRAWRWGAGTNGAHGNNNTTVITWPTLLETSPGSGTARTDVAQVVTAGSSVTTARAASWIRTTAGKVLCAGDQSYGIGDGATLGGTNATTFQAAAGAIDALTVTALYAGGGEYYNCVAITSTGQGYLVGYIASYGQLGNGSTTNLNTFTIFSGLPASFAGNLTRARIAGGNSFTAIYIEATISGVKTLGAIGYDVYYATAKNVAGVAAASQTWGLVQGAWGTISDWQTFGTHQGYGLAVLTTDGELRYAGANDQGQGGTNHGAATSVPILQPIDFGVPRLLKPPINRGAYSALAEYSKQDVVTQAGSSWIYTSETAGAGNAPPALPATSNSYWQLLAARGDTGITTDLANDVNGNAYSIYGVTNTYNDQTGTTYTLQATDTGNVLTFDNAANVTVTVPATLPVGFSCTVIQLGAGQVIFTGGATINHVQGHDRTFGQYAMAILAVYANSGGSAAVACLSGATDN